MTHSRDFVPAREVKDYVRAYEWNPETATEKLGPIFGSSWFWNAIQPRLSFGPMEEAEAVEKLAEACDAAPEYGRQLRLLLDFLTVAGLIEREGTQIKARQGGKRDSPVAETPSPAAPRHESKGHTPSVSPNAINLSFSIHVDMNEIAGWSPDRITAFFSGFAQVLAAKGDKGA